MNRKGRNLGVISARSLKVFDCKDKTFAYYPNGKLKGNWNKAAEGYIYQTAMTSYGIKLRECI